MTQSVLKIVFMSLAVLDLNKCCIILVFNVKVKNLAFAT